MSYSKANRDAGYRLHSGKFRFKMVVSDSSAMWISNNDTKKVKYSFWLFSKFTTILHHGI